MALNKYIIKNTRRQAAVKFTGTGTANVDIWELASSNQSITTANLELIISDVIYDVATTSNVKRSGNIVYTMSAGQNAVKLTGDFGLPLAEQANANVMVTVGGTVDGTVILQFSKGAGYNDLDVQSLQAWQKN